MVQFEPVSLRPAMEQTLRTYRLNAEDRQVDLRLEVAPDLPEVLGNWDLILQVLDNLVGNALKFSRPGGPLMLRLRLARQLRGEGPGHRGKRRPHLRAHLPFTEAAH